MTEKEVMKFVIERSNDPIIKNPVLREAMNKDLGPRTMFGQGSSVDSAVRTVDPVQDSGNKIEEVLKAYELYRKNRSGKRPMKFKTFFEEYGKENFATGGQAGQLVSNTVDGSRPGYSGREYSQKNIDQLSDDLLKAYAKDDITLVMDPKHKSSISEIRTNRRGSLDKAIKNTGLDEETIFNLLDDREAYVELEKVQETVGGRPVEKGKAKFYKQAENWIVKNSKRYADPDKFKKAFIRTFGKDNDIIQKINKPGVLGKRNSTLGSVPFSDWFRLNIMGSSEQAMKGQTKPSYSAKQLDQIFKTAIYTNNENVRNKIINELTNILPEEGSKRTPDIRDKFKNSPLLKKFGLNQKIDGPIARLLAKEVGDDLLKQISLFRKPFLGTTELITYLKDRVNPKYKSMFEEAAKATGFAQRNSWPQARQALNSSNSIMFDHKIPKALIEAGYADEIEYIKLNPTSDKFNATIKRTQFDQPMIKLSKEFEITKSLDGKAKVVEKMNELKNNFSKKYGGYLDEISITPDKTGKPMFKSSASPITKKTDLVSSLGKSMFQAGEINENKASKFAQRMMAFCPAGSKRVKKAGGGGAGPTCSMEQAQAGLKKQADAATKASKNGKIPKKFGKLRSFLTFAFGVADPLIETLLVLPELFAGNPDAAIQSSSLGWFTDKGKFDLEKLKDTNPKAYQYLKDIRATKEYNEAVNTLDELEPFLAKAEAEGTLDQVNPEFLEQYRNAKKRYVSIPEEYEEYGYVEGGSDTPLTARVEFQQYLRDKVKSDYEKGRRRVDINNMTTQELKDLTNFKYLKKDPNTKYEDIYTAPTDLKSFIDQKGELGKDTMLQYGVRNEAERIGDEGVYDIFDTYAGGYAGVETPGELNIYKDLKTVPPSMGFKEDGFSVKKPGIKDVRDAYAELPKDYAGQLAALEKEELIQGLKRKGMFNTRRFKDLLESQQMDTDELYAQGGLANLMKKYND
jgi:hypothetical protein